MTSLYTVMSQCDITYYSAMGRWQPGAAGRLAEAALDLYVERGYEQTTVVEIAERAGVTARTFFRYYTDKREVLFVGSEVLRQRMVDALAAAPADATPFEAVAVALDAVAEILGTDQRHSARRQQVLMANTELRERELIKMSRLADALTEGLVARGVAQPDARLAAEAEITVFRVAFETWVTGPASAELATLIRDSSAQLGRLSAAAEARTPPVA
jgi:AcrR family transcriptional regulator